MKSRNETGGASVEICDVRKSYGQVEVLHGVSLDVPAGSFTTFLGPSGSGKTTTLGIMSGLVSPSSGSVLIGGTDCTRMPVHRRELGFVFQSYALFPNMSVAKNVAFPLKMRRVGRQEMKQRVAEALELVRLSEYGSHYPAQLSGGQQQRVALARAVVFRPRVLLMDEPLGALDAGLRVHLQREIVRVGRELGITIIYVTHDQSEALTMSDQIALFRDGRIEQLGTPRDLYNAPASEFTAQFIGNAPLLHGVLDVQQDVAHVTHSGGRFPVSAASVAARGIAAGSAVAAVLRPEYLRLERPASGAKAVRPESTWTVAEGVVSDVIYAGSELRLTLQLADGTELRCDWSTHESDSWQVGDVGRVHVRPECLPPVVPAGVGPRLTPATSVPVAQPRGEPLTEAASPVA
jgi:ABC-type Fe3+/spermidine/putrescine transport system ATPase subunit